MKTLTVFTPTYNRAHTLERLYQSLCAQTCQDFDWLVIDDGSTDDTKGLIEKFSAEGRISIRYIYKDNGGLYTGYNVAYQTIETELNVCIDSDDAMPERAEKRCFPFGRKKTPTVIAAYLGWISTWTKESPSGACSPPE